jgi:hypothetical protein
VRHTNHRKNLTIDAPMGKLGGCSTYETRIIKSRDWYDSLEPTRGGKCLVKKGKKNTSKVQWCGLWRDQREFLFFFSATTVRKGSVRASGRNGSQVGPSDLPRLISSNGRGALPEPVLSPPACVRRTPTDPPPPPHRGGPRRPPSITRPVTAPHASRQASSPPLPTSSLPAGPAAQPERVARTRVGRGRGAKGGGGVGEAHTEDSEGSKAWARRRGA